MRSAALLFAFLALVGASFLVPERDAPEAGTNTILAQVTRHGFPIRAQVELRRVADLPPPDVFLDDQRFRRLFGEYRWDAPPLRTARSSPDGRCRFDGLATGEYELTVRVSDGNDTRHRVDLRISGEVWHERLEIVPTEHEVRGRATWTDGRPFQGEVYIWGKRARSDASGRFRLTGASVHATHVDFCEPGRIYRRFHLPADGSLEVVVDEGLVWLEGSVVAAGSGAPVGGARILARSRGRPESECLTCAFTGHDGRYRLPVLSGGFLEVRAPGHLPIEVRDTDVAPRIRLEPSPVVTGVVRTPEGRPVAGAPVMLASIHRGRFGEFFMPTEARSTTDQQGRFRIESPVTGDVTVSVLGAGWVSRGIEDATLSGYNPTAISLDAGTVHRVNHVVVPAPSIEGRVLDAEGAPVAGITLKVEEVDDPGSEGRYLLGWTGRTPSVATDREGRFRFPSLHPGLSWNVCAQPWQEDDVIAGPVTPGLGETATLEVRLAQTWTRRLTVRVVEEESGAPITGATFRLDRIRDENEAQAYAFHYAAPVTDPDGRACFDPVAPGPLTVTVRHPTLVCRKDVPVDRDDMEIRMAKGRVIAGRVVYPDGSPVAGVYLYFSGLDGSCRLDADGRFRRQDLLPGFHTLRVSSTIEDTCFRGDAKVEAGREDVEITLVPDEWEPLPAEGPEILVRVVDERERPVDAGTVRFWAQRVGRDTFWSPFRTGLRRIEEGAARFHLENGEGKVWIDVCPRDSALGAVLVGPHPRDVGTVTITILHSGQITGRVLDPDGAAIPGVRVFALPTNTALEAAGGTARKHSAAYTSSDGRFALGGIGPGTYHIWAAGPPRLFPRFPESARAGDDVTIRMQPAAAPVVTVLDTRGRPVRECRIGLYPADAERPLRPYDTLRETETDHRGRARFRRLDPEATYLLAFDPPYDRDDLEETVLEDWEPVDRTVRLAKARVLRGVVRDRATGFGVGGACVWVRPPEEEEGWGRQWTEADGTFEIDDIPWEPLHLRAGPESSEPDSDGVVERIVGAKECDVELRIDAGPCLTVKIRGWPCPDDTSAWVGDRDGCGQHGIPRDGMMHIFGLEEADAYRFHAALPDGRMAWATDLRRDRVNELDLVPGKEIRVAVEWPRRATRKHIFLSGNGLFLHDLKKGPKGEYVARGLPDGPYTAMVSCRVGERKFKGEALVRAGERVDIKLEEK